jgi:ketosteroid isomerase-like protein
MEPPANTQLQLTNAPTIINALRFSYARSELKGSVVRQHCWQGGALPRSYPPSIRGQESMRIVFAGFTFAALSIACAAPASKAADTSATASSAVDAAAHKAHENYVRVINSNNIDSLASMLTDDVVFLAAGERPVVGKAAVRAWVDGYYKAFHTKWDKPVQEFVVSGDYAFERYSYTSTDTPVGGGKDAVDTGWGFVVYHRDADGTWRVARDAFGPDHPPATK